MAKSILDLLDESESTGRNSGITNLVSILFKAQMEAHITHILQRKKLLCEHQALATFYDEIDGLIDSLAELCMAHGLINNISVSSCSEIVNSESYFKNLYTQVEGYRSEISVVPFLTNKLDEIQELISQTIYRLKFIQS